MKNMMKRNTTRSIRHKALGCAPPGYRLEAERCNAACRDLGLRPPVQPLADACTPSRTTPLANAAPATAVAPPVAAALGCCGDIDLPAVEQVLEIRDGGAIVPVSCDLVANRLRQRGRCSCVLDGAAVEVPAGAGADRPADAALADTATAVPIVVPADCAVALADAPAPDPVAATTPAAGGAALLGELRLVGTVMGDVAVPEPPVTADCGEAVAARPAASTAGGFADVDVSSTTPTAATPSPGTASGQPGGTA